MINFTNLKSEHCELLYRWRNSPEVRVNMHNSQEIQWDEHNAWFSRLISKKDKTHWLVLNNEKPIGVVNTELEDKSAKWLYWGMYVGDKLSRESRLGGIVAYRFVDFIFKNKILNKVCCTVLSHNTNALSMNKRLGFKVDGVLRQHGHKDGEYFDVVEMSMLKTEWDKQRLLLEKVIDKIDK